MRLLKNILILMAIIAWLLGLGYCFASVHLGSTRVPFTFGKAYYLAKTDQLNKDEKVFFAETYKLIFKFPA